MTLTVRFGWAEFLMLASLAIGAGIVAAAIAGGWTIALVPGITYGLAIVGAYGLYQRLEERAQIAAEVPAPARFQVVDTRGVCPLGHRKGDLLTVDAAGSVAPQVCPAAAAVLELAADSEEEVQEWCCPVYDHMLVFRRQLKAA